MLLIWFTMFSLMVREYKSSPRVLSAVKQETFFCFFRRTLPFFSRILTLLNFHRKVANNCNLRNLGKPGYQRNILKHSLFSAWSFITTVNSNVSFTFNPFLLLFKSQIFSHIFKETYFSRKWS